MGAHADLRQQVHPISIDIDAGVGGRHALEKAEKQRGAGNVQRLPIAEDHDRQSQKAEPRHIAGSGTVGGGQSVNEASHARQRAGDGGSGVAHLIDVDPQRVGRLGIFATGAQTQTESGLIENDGQHHKQKDTDIGSQIDLMEKGVAEKAQICCAVKAQRGLFDHEPTGGIAFRHLKRILVGQDTDEKEHQGGGHKVQGRAADGLIGPQIHGGEREQQGEHRPQHRRHQHGQQLKALKRHPVVRRFRRREDTGLLRQVDKEHPREGTEDHNALKSQVDDTAALGKDGTA